MPKRSYELYLAMAVALLIGMVYLLIAENGLPGSSGLLGHSLGVVGFLLMLGAETLYSWRKEMRGPGRGRMSTWLQAHVFFGLVGPFMVLLHSAWRLHGLAGLLMLVTMLMVASGFLCRYVYTAVPRTVDGAELTLRDLEAQVTAAHSQVQEWRMGHPAAVALLGDRLVALAAPSPVAGSNAKAVLGGTLPRWRYHWQVQHELRQLAASGNGQALELAQLLERQKRLETQAQSLASARRFLGLSRTIHVVLGVVVFALAFVHIGMALYFATLAR